MEVADNFQSAPATHTPSKTAEVQQVRETTAPNIPCDSIPEDRKVALSAISFDANIQIRASISKSTVAEYAERMSEGERFPSVQLFADGDRYFIGDGWHRLEAAKKLGYSTFPAVVNVGGRTAALKFALSANASHGLPRTNEDKFRALTIAANEFPSLSNREMARICAVSEGFVRGQRPRCAQNAPAKRVGADGKNYPASKTTREPNDANIKLLQENKTKRACAIIAKRPIESLTPVRQAIEARLKTLHEVAPVNQVASSEAA